MIIEATLPAENTVFGCIVGLVIGQEFRGIKLVNSANQVVAIAGFDHWHPNSAAIHIWIRNPGDLRRKFIREVFNYVFVTCNKGVVLGATPCNNVAALELNRRIGFRVVARIKDGWELGTDLAIQELRKEDCRWIKPEVPNECRHSRAA